MASHSRPTSHREPDTRSYAALPGTEQATFVPTNMTYMKSKIRPEREVPGCHPSRWVWELLNNSFTVCDLFERARHAGIDHYAWSHKHRLVMNGNQSFNKDSCSLLSALCIDCHYHFVFKMSWEEAHCDDMCHPSQAAWPLGDNLFPWHHLVWVGSDSESNIAAGQSKYYPILAREEFACSAGPCTFQLILEISQPRFGPSIMRLLSDHEAIRRQLEIAKEREPARYEAAVDDWAYQAPLNLNTYLRNLLDSSPDTVRTISKRNKRFAVLFGPRCFSIFRLLEFDEDVQDRDGVDEGSFTPHPPPPAASIPGMSESPTELGTYRAYIEDARAEVQCLIHKNNQATESPSWAMPLLTAHLRCQALDVRNISQANLERYSFLGVLPGQRPEAVVNAYKRQWDLMPRRHKELVDSLMGVANDLGDDMLCDYAITQSSIFDSQLQRVESADGHGLVSQALNFLGLEPPNTYSAATIIQAFRIKVSQDLLDAGTARSMLLLIARASTDDNYQAALLMEADNKMSLETAKTVLGLGLGDVSEDQILDAFYTKLKESSCSELAGAYVDTLDAIADHISSPQLKQTCYEQRKRLNFPDADMTSTSLAESVNFELPVGLDNIGNTCYLNSLLQYLFTVRPVREIVLNYDHFKLELSDERIQGRRLGGNKMHMDRGEAVVAQAFVRELSSLFQSLQVSRMVATRPSQRLANAVLLSTHTLLKSPKAEAEGARTTTPKPPPLPARPSSITEMPRSEDVDMVDGSMHRGSSVMLASNPSSETLIDPEETRPGAKEELVEHVPFSLTEAQTEVAEIRLEDIDTAASKSTQVECVEEERPFGTANLSGDSETMAAISGMSDTGETETIDQKVLTALEHQKRSSGTDQQDVEEVMGSIINRLQAAIRPSSIDPKSGIQLERIMETFFVTTINYTRKFGVKDYQHEISFDRSITAFPAAEGPCSLYDALGRNFDQQILEESKLSRYTAVKSLPPILHILIQRTQSIGSKNGNAVVIPEILYLDRYMDAPHGSPLFARRFQDWMLAERVADIKAQLAKADASAVDPRFLYELDERSADTLGESNNADSDPSSGSASAITENWDFDGPVEDDFILIKRDDRHASCGGGFPPRPEAMDLISQSIRQMMEDELRRCEEALNSHLESMNEIPYRLHAVICHRGHLTSGHYWVWICDFEEKVWRKYNDADVRESRDTAEVLQALSTSGEPYFLCYVRDKDKEEYVNVPKRQHPEPEESPEDAFHDQQYGDEEVAAEEVAAEEVAAEEVASDVKEAEEPPVGES